MIYLQVLTDGMLIVLEADGRRHEYHSGAGDPFLCTTPRPPVGD
jgi:hypothetical protein